MILVLPFIAGLLLAILRIQFTQAKIQAPNIRLIWILVFVFVPQLIVIILPRIFTPLNEYTSILSNDAIAIMIFVSNIALMVFCWFNRTIAGFWLLGFGTFLNFIVMTVNGGFMPATADILAFVDNQPHLEVSDYLFPGQRTGGLGKGIVMPIEETQLWWLSDVFATRAFGQAVFSLGDIVIAAGIIRVFWGLGESQSTSANTESVDST